MLRLEPEVAEQLVSLEVMVTATAPTGSPGENVICIPCTRVFTPADHDFSRPLVIDFIRNTPSYKVAWFIISYDTGRENLGRLYHWIDFPESGVASSTAIITASCLDVVCLDEATDCVRGPLCRDPVLPVAVRDRLWVSAGVVCADDCGLPEPDADADAEVDVDVDAGADADADAEGDAGDAESVTPDDGGP